MGYTSQNELTKYLTNILLIVLLISCNSKKEDLKIVFTGDIILDRGVKDELSLHGDSLLTNSFGFLGKPEFLIVNLEGALTDSGIQQTDKYNFKADTLKASVLKKAGVTHVSIANNHIYDYGKIGYINTLNALENNNLKPLGNTNHPTIITNGKYKCAVLSASLTAHNDSLPISSIKDLKSSIKTFLYSLKSIPLVLYIHWGLELQPRPEKWQTNLAKELVNLGVDAIIGHHPHITQTIEFINDKPIIYSLGNFIADAYLPNTQRSYIVELGIKDNIESIKLIPTRLDRYFPKQLSLNEQISDIKEHIKCSDISLSRENLMWNIKQTNKINFSESTDLWLYSEKNTISTIKKINPYSHLLEFQKNGKATIPINLHGKLSEFQIADINNDSQIDILIGINKKVKFDPTIKKRINIYTLQDDALIPLWLGTKFIHDVESFDIFINENKNYLTTIERINETKKAKRVYEWDDFGFALTELN